MTGTDRWQGGVNSIAYDHISMLDSTHTTVRFFLLSSVHSLPCLCVQMYQHLDEFVIGQQRAKKVLSVAMYNHYKRLNSSMAAACFSSDRESEEMAELNAQPPIGTREWWGVVSCEAQCMLLP